MYRLLFDGMVFPFATLEQALNANILQEQIKSFITALNVNFTILYYFISCNMIFAVIICVLYGIINLLIWLLNKVYRQVEILNKQIPDIKEM